MLNAPSNKPIHLNVSLLYFTLLQLKIDLKSSLALQFYFAAIIQISESLHREVIYKRDLQTPFKTVETFTIINFWKVAFSRIPCFRKQSKDI